MRPYDIDVLYDTIVLGTAVSPGVVMLRGHVRDKDWDVKKAKGQTGATTTLNGDPVGSFEATFFLADDGYPDPDGPTDFDNWEDFRRVIESTTNGPKPIALPIYHPDLAAQHFTEVVCGSIGGMVHDGKGGATVTVKFLEYRPPKPKAPSNASAKEFGTGSGTGTRVQEKPDPNAAAKKQLQSLLDQARAP